MAHNVGTALDKAGVTRIIFIRHANAAPPGGKKKAEYNGIHDWQKDDQMRPLTDKGKQQGAVARVWYEKDIGVPTNKILITSGARRASETLQVLCEEKAKKSIFSAFCTSSNTVGMAADMELVGSLHPAGIAPKCEALFDTHGYAPLAKFYGMEGGEEAFAEYGDVVCKELEAVAERVAMKKGNTLSCFGHAVFLNAAAMQLIKTWGAEEATVKQLVDLDLGEAEGILIERAGDKCSIKHMSVRPHALWA